MLHEYLPSPTRSVWYLGPFPLRAYALSIIAGVILAIWLAERRWKARGGRPGVIADIAIWAVPLGLIGGRVYHVVTDAELYFDKGTDWVKLFYIWDGGLGIPGAVALGGVGVWVGARRAGVRWAPLADVIAPTLAFAQCLGRWGNWFNNELYGDRTTMPWGLTIHPNARDSSAPVITAPGHYQPTFLYESVWDLGTGALVIWAERRFKLGHGRAFALYAATYCVGRGWIEAMRSDYAHRFFGLRLNDWMSVLVFVAAVGYLVVSSRRRPGRESTAELYLPGRAPLPPTAATDDDADDMSGADGTEGGRRTADAATGDGSAGRAGP
jgi:prolipoprotein diacylglyceryl transferase